MDKNLPTKSINFVKVKSTNKHLLFLSLSIFVFLVLSSTAAIIGIKNKKTPKVIDKNSQIAQNSPKDAKSISFYIESSQELLNKARFISTQSDKQTEQEKGEIIETVKKAINTISEGIKIYPSDDRLYAQRSEIYSSLAPFLPEAINFGIIDLKQAISLNSKNPEYYKKIALLYQNSQNYDKAASSFFNAYKLEPTNSQNVYNLAFSLEKSGQIQQAIKYYDKLISLLEPNNSDLELIKTKKESLQKLLAESGLKYLTSPAEELPKQAKEEDYLGLDQLPLEQAMAKNNLLIASPEENKASEQNSKTLSNAKTGKGLIKAGEAQVTIENKNVAADKRIVISPTKDLENQVLTVVSKKSGEWFKVAISKALDFDAEFEYWIID